MNANKFNREYMSSPISSGATPSDVNQLGLYGHFEPPRPTVIFERSLIACHSNPAIVAEARRQYLLRGVWQKLLSPLSIVCEAIAEGARTHGDVLNPRSSCQLRRSTTSTVLGEGPPEREARREPASAACRRSLSTDGLGG